MGIKREWLPFSFDGIKYTYTPDVTQMDLDKSREEAKQLLAKTGAEHVVYGIKCYNDDRVLEEIKLKSLALSDKAFRAYVRAPDRIGDLVLALHNCDTDEGKIDAVVDFIVETGTSETTSGAYTVCYDEIGRNPELAFATENWLKSHHEEIKHALDGRAEILSETWDETDSDGNIYGFDCNFCGMYCPHWEEDGVFEAG